MAAIELIGCGLTVTIPNFLRLGYGDGDYVRGSIPNKATYSPPLLTC